MLGEYKTGRSRNLGRGTDSHSFNNIPHDLSFVATNMPLVTGFALIGLKFSNDGVSAFGALFDHSRDDYHSGFPVLVALLPAAFRHGLGMPGFASTLLEVIELGIHNRNVTPGLLKIKNYGITRA